MVYIDMEIEWKRVEKENVEYVLNQILLISCLIKLKRDWVTLLNRALQEKGWNTNTEIELFFPPFLVFCLVW